MFKFFTREELAEALTIIVNAKSPNLKVELHNIKEYDARTIWFFSDNDVITLMLDETPLGEECSVYSYDFKLADVKGHELAIAEEIEWMQFNILVNEEDLLDEEDEFLDEDGPTCDVSKEGDIIRVETFCTSPVCDEDFDIISAQYHTQMPDKLKVKKIECEPYPEKGNILTFESAREVTMKELLLMVQKIIEDAEKKGVLSRFHDIWDLVLEEIVIKSNGTINVYLGS